MNSRIPCVQSWTGPSPNNNFDTCHWDKWVNNNVADPIVPASIVTVMMVVVLIAFPTIMLMRYLCCSCGSCTQRPDADCCTCLRRRRRPFSGLFYTTLQRNSGMYGEQTTLVAPVVDGEMPVYSTKSVRRAKRTAYRAAWIGIVATIFACVGMALVVRALQDGTEGVDDMLNNNLAGKLTDLKTVTSSGTGTYYEPLTPQSFSSAEDAIKDANAILKEFKRLMFNGNSNGPNWNQGRSGRSAAWIFATVAVCLIPLSVLAIGACSACCNVRRVVPLCVSLLMFMFFLFAGVSAITMIGTHFATEVATNEVNAQSLRSASILQWYTVPQCQANPPFQSLGNAVTAAFQRKAFSACSNAVASVNGGGLCDSSTAYTSTLPNTIFVCQPSAAVQCDSPSAVESFVRRGLKSGAPEGICGPIPNSQCTVTQCSEFCTDATIRQLAASVVRDATISRNIKTAYTNDVAYVQDCNTLLDTLIREVGGRNAVKRVSDALVMGTVSSVLFMVALIVGMIAMVRGQKRFIRDNETFTESGYVPVQTAVQPFVTSSKSPMAASPHQAMYGVPVQSQQGTSEMTPALLEAIVQDDTTCCRGNNYGSC